MAEWTMVRVRKGTRAAIQAYGVTVQRVLEVALLTPGFMPATEIVDASPGGQGLGDAGPTAAAAPGQRPTARPLSPDEASDGRRGDSVTNDFLPGVAPGRIPPPAGRPFPKTGQGKKVD